MGPYAWAEGGDLDLREQNARKARQFAGALANLRSVYRQERSQETSTRSDIPGLRISQSRTSGKNTNSAHER